MRGYIEDNDQTECCGNCAYYTQHYTRMPGGWYAKCYMGHCRNPRLKNRRPDQVCEKFKRIENEQVVQTDGQAEKA